MNTALAWLLQLGTSWALFGLIWVVQLVHYPSFRYVSAFPEFHLHHTRSISYIVAPLMVAELAVALWFLWRNGFTWLWWVPLGMVVLIWLQTFLVAIPLHDQLGQERADVTIERLIAANWPRTVLWTCKSVYVSILFLWR